MIDHNTNRHESAAARESWFVANHDKEDQILRGPYATSSEAGAVRAEMERQEKYAEINLWIVPESHVRS